MYIYVQYIYNTYVIHILYTYMHMYMYIIYISYIYIKYVTGLSIIPLAPPVDPSAPKCRDPSGVTPPWPPSPPPLKHAPADGVGT